MAWAAQNLRSGFSSGQDLKFLKHKGLKLGAVQIVIGLFSLVVEIVAGYLDCDGLFGL
jgi:hypothetical protein